MSASPRFKGVVFDMDGILVNTEDLYDEVGKQILQRRGREFTRDVKLQMMGRPGPVAFEVMRQLCDVDDSALVLQGESEQIMAELIAEGVVLLPGVENLIGLLRGRRIPFSVATSSTREIARLALGQLNIYDEFFTVLTSEDVTNGKPDPEIYQLAARRMELEAGEIVVFEDSLPGSEAAVGAGAFTVAVPTEHTAHCDFSHVDLRVSQIDDSQVRALFAD